ncbi:hypothetical protein STEG23_024789 [Scotinomys teguina]
MQGITCGTHEGTGRMYPEEERLLGHLSAVLRDQKLLHGTGFWSVIHAGYCFLPDLSAEKTDGDKEDSRCSQGPRAEHMPALQLQLLIRSGPTATTQHPVSQHLPVPTAWISVPLQLQGQAKCEDAYGDIGCTHRQRKEGKAESRNLGLWRRTL